MSTCVTLLANLLCVWSVLTEVVLVVVVMLATSWLLHHQLTTRVILVFSLDLTSVPGRTVRFLVSSRNYLNFVIHYSMPCLALALKVQCAHVVAAGLTGHCFVGHGISRSHITGYIYYCVQATASTTRWRVSQSRRRCHVSSSRCRDQLQAALTSDILFSAPSSTFLPFSSTVIYCCYYTGFSPIFKYYTVVHKRCGSGSKLFATTYANLDQFLYFLHHIFYERDAAHWLYCVLQFASVPYWQHALGVAGFDEYQLVMLLMWCKVLHTCFTTLCLACTIWHE